MKFAFETLDDFWKMSGHGVYVWSCWILTAIGIIGLITFAIAQRRRFWSDYAKKIKREQQQ